MPEAPAQVFSCEFCDISKNTIFQRTPLVVASVLLKSKLVDPLCKVYSHCTPLDGAYCVFHMFKSFSWRLEVLRCRSSRSQMFFKIGVLKIAQISQENTCVRIFF